MESGYAVYILDESIFPVAPYITYGWYPKGSRPIIKYQHKRNERYCVFGALNSEEFIYEFVEKFNSDTYALFLDKLLHIHNKIVIVIDSASYHVSKQMQEYYKKHKDNLHVVYLPSYSPELNPIEQSWRETKKFLSIKCWKNLKELKEQLISAFQQPFIMTPLYDYLIP